jgi:ABC-type branched-subunit amino acid transport system permease subunit
MLISTIWEERKASLVVIPLALVALAVAPRVVSGSQLITMITVLEFATLTLAWTMFSGPTRYVSLATAALFGVGVYTSALLRDTIPIEGLALIGAAGAFVVAFAIGLLTLRLRGVYFILFTFGVTALIRSSVQWWESTVSHTVGRHLRGATNETVYLLMAIIFALTLITAFLLANSKAGIALVAIGENQEAAQHVGINVTRVKVLTFAASAVFMGAAGAVMATRFRYIEPAIAFSPLVSFLPVVMAIFGGVTRLWGPILGTVVLIVVQQVLISETPYWYLLIFGLILVVTVVWLQGGLVELVIRAYWWTKIKYLTYKMRITMWWKDWREA